MFVWCNKIADLTSLNYSCLSRSWNECIHGSPRYVTYAPRYKYRQHAQLHILIQIQIQLLNRLQKQIQIQSLPKLLYSQLNALRYVCNQINIQTTDTNTDTNADTFTNTTTDTKQMQIQWLWKQMYSQLTTHKIFFLIFLDENLCLMTHFAMYIQSWGIFSLSVFCFIPECYWLWEFCSLRLICKI